MNVYVVFLLNQFFNLILVGGMNCVDINRTPKRERADFKEDCFYFLLKNASAIIDCNKTFK